jgi:hypothetical protein
MNKFLFFQNAANDCNVYPLAKLKSVEGEDSIIKFTFDVAAGVDTISVTLNAGADELLSLKAIGQLINKHPHGDGIIVIADDVAGVYAHSSMISVGAAA